MVHDFSKFYLHILMAIFFQCSVVCTQGQASSCIKFITDTSLDRAKFAVVVYDGIGQHDIALQDKDSWCGELYAPLGYLAFLFKDSDSTYLEKKVFFKSGNSRVCLAGSRDSSGYYEIDLQQSENVVSYAQMGGELFDAYIKNVSKARSDYLKINRRKLGIDTILQKAIDLSHAIVYKKFDFIIHHPDLYLSSWAFRDDIVNSELFTPDTLLNVYKNRLTNQSYKKSKAGSYLLHLIENKIAVAQGLRFPDFSVYDINKRKLELSKLRGKYVLVQIWASWCTPCVAEMPDLKEMYNKYKDSNFELISFSIDRDATAFKKAVEKYEMNWSLVYGNNELYNALGTLPIPLVYLIDKNGKIIYNRDSTKDFSFILLKQTLSDLLGK